MKRITYFAFARNSEGKVEQIFVERRDGKAFIQNFTGKVYKNEKDAASDIKYLNQRFAHSILS